MLLLFLLWIELQSNLPARAKIPLIGRLECVLRRFCRSRILSFTLYRFLGFLGLLRPCIKSDVVNSFTVD